VAYTHKNSDDELTPPEAYEPLLESMGRTEFDIDVASHPQALVPAIRRFFGPHRGHIDGLTAPWERGDRHSDVLCFCQPPYGNPAPWIRKASEHQSIVLVNATTDTKVWHEVVFPLATCVLWVRGRIRFISPHEPERRAPAKKPSAVIWFNCEPLHLEPLERLGRLCIP